MSLDDCFEAGAVEIGVLHEHEEARFVFGPASCQRNRREVFRAYDPLPDDDSGDWGSCMIEIHQCRPPEQLSEILLACDVVPGVYGPRAQIHWRSKWKTQITMYYELQAAIDTRSVNYLSQFSEE